MENVNEYVYIAIIGVLYFAFIYIFTHSIQNVWHIFYNLTKIPKKRKYKKYREKKYLGIVGGIFIAFCSIFMIIVLSFYL